MVISLTYNDPKSKNLNAFLLSISWTNLVLLLSLGYWSQIDISSLPPPSNLHLLTFSFLLRSVLRDWIFLTKRYIYFFVCDIFELGFMIYFRGLKSSYFYGWYIKIFGSSEFSLLICLGKYLPTFKWYFGRGFFSGSNQVVLIKY